MMSGNLNDRKSHQLKAIKFKPNRLILVQTTNRNVMKKLISFSLFLTILLLALAARNISQAQVIVTRAVPAVMIKPVCPQRGYIWSDGYYRWNKRMNRHVWIDGYWARPRYHRKGVRVRVW
jgi:WXXGXW repeat (2 copies)